MRLDECCREMSGYILCSCLYSSQLQTSSLLVPGLTAPTLLLICRNITNLHVPNVEGRAASAGLEDTLLHNIPGVVVQCCFPSNTNQIPLKAGTCLIQFNFQAANNSVTSAARERNEVPRSEGSGLRRQPDAAWEQELPACEGRAGLWG